jgi:uncharacterized protein YkwD
LFNLPQPLALLSARALFAWPACALFAHAVAAASPQSDAEQLTALINNYRTAPGTCQGHPEQAVAPLTPQPVLSSLRLGPGMILSAALERAGYPNAQADFISVTGPQHPQAAMEAIQQRYCRILLSTNYTDMGSSRSGAEWTLIFARPAPPLPSVTFQDWTEAGQIILEGVNQARASGHTCGDQAYPPAPPLRWNPLLGEAALAHSRDMAERRYFNHQDKNGGTSGERAKSAGYAWSRIGENIAFGQYTPQEAVAGWLTSPGHCTNIMNRDFTEMGAAYAVTPEKRAGLIYWTQVFGKPR